MHTVMQIGVPWTHPFESRTLLPQNIPLNLFVLSLRGSPTRLLLEYLLLSHNIGLPITGPNAIKNNNQGAIDWSKGTTTKKMHWVDLQENIVCENVLINKNIQVSHIPGKANLSDIFTKEFRDVTKFLFLRDLFMISSTEFSTGIRTSGWHHLAHHGQGHINENQVVYE